MPFTEEEYFTMEFASDILRDVVLKQNIIEPVYEITTDNYNSYGFLSFIIKIKAKGRNKEQAYIIKAAQQNKEVRKQVAIRAFYLQEIMYYRDILPVFENFQSSRNVKSPFKSYPKCYKTMTIELNEMLVLENLIAGGFKLHGKTEQMNDAHVKLVLREYGKLHAISLAMKDQDIKRFNDLANNIDNPFSVNHISSEMFDLYKRTIEMVMVSFDPSSELNIIKALTNFSKNIIGVFEDLDNYKSKSSVMVHGDCWYNNMMFKYQDEDSKTPTEVRFFDFQLGKLSTPVVDISYFLYSCMTDEILQNLDYYLKIYHDSLRDYMYEMGSDVDKYYPFVSLIEEWKVYCKVSVIFSSIIYRITIREEDEAVTLTDAPKNASISLVDVFLNKSKNEDLINQRYRKLFLHLYERGCI